MEAQVTTDQQGNTTYDVAPEQPVSDVDAQLGKLMAEGSPYWKGDEATVEAVQKLMKAKYEGGEVPDVQENITNLRTVDPIAAEEQQTISALKQQWGANYDANVKTIQEFVTNLGEPVVEMLQDHDAELGNDPVVGRILLNMSRGQTTGLTKAEAVSLLSKLTASKLYQSTRYSEQHEMVVDIVYQLHKLLTEGR